VRDLYKHVDVVKNRYASGRTAEVYRQAKREMGLLPEAVVMFSPDTGILTASWATFREPLLAGSVPRRYKESVAATVSRLNECPYCVDAHSIMLYGGGAGTTATAVLAGLPTGQFGGEFAELCQWAELASAAGTAPRAAPFPDSWAPEILGVLVEFHYLNRMINVLLTGTFLFGDDRARRIARRVVGRIMSKKINAENDPGASPGLPAAAALPPDLAWAAPSPPIAAAFTMLDSVSNEAARRAASPAVLDVVERTVDGWLGGPPGVSTSWVNEPLAALPEADRPAARIALLAAISPYQITEADVQAYRVGHPGDRDLLGLLSWSAFLAARRVGSWAARAARVP
jgi:AhpD family alkylhydroperoxidase